MIGFSSKILWVGALLALAKADTCQEVCTKDFPDKDLEAACHQGCDKFKTSKFSEFSLVQLFLEGDKTLELCRDSCQETFKDDNLLGACKQGCQNNQNEDYRPKTLFDISNDFFKSLEANDSHRHGGVTVSFGLPKMMMRDFDNGWMDEPVSMMTRMNQQMNHMMESMKTGVSSLMNGGETDAMRSGGGKMYIMKSGPGYHEEKTYDIDPNGQMTLIKNDMMEKQNPLDSMDDHDVEVFEPVEQEEEFAKIIKEDKESPEEEKLIKPILQEIDRQLDRQFAEQRKPWFGFKNEFKNVEGPRLPETGLRSRDICHNEDKKWSTWVNCLHLKLGMPRWFMTTSICLGIIFLLWLCFVIPSNAPKQRVKNKTSKEVEAFSPVVITEKSSYDPKDLPPAYDDVAKQLEPVHQKPTQTTEEVA